MRLLAFFALACTASHAVTALSTCSSEELDGECYLAPRDGPSAFDVQFTQILDARSRKQLKISQNPKPHHPDITFAKGASHNDAQHALDNLRLHGKKRRIVENYHKNFVTNYMKTVPNAHSAVIKNLAHATGSRDPIIHISAQIADARGSNIPAPRHGEHGNLYNTHHIYIDKESKDQGYHLLPIEYRKALNKKLIREGREPGHI